MDFFLTRKLGQAMRENNFEVTATLDFAQRRSRKPRLIRVEPGDTTSQALRYRHRHRHNYGLGAVVGSDLRDYQGVFGGI